MSKIKVKIFIRLSGGKLRGVRVDAPPSLVELLAEKAVSFAKKLEASGSGEAQKNLRNASGDKR